MFNRAKSAEQRAADLVGTLIKFEKIIKAIEDGARFRIAVDYSVVHKYLFPFDHIILGQHEIDDKTQNELAVEQACLSLLFEVSPVKLNQPNILLRPYASELKSMLKLKMSLARDGFNNIQSNDIHRRLAQLLKKISTSIDYDLNDTTSIMSAMQQYHDNFVHLYNILVFDEKVFSHRENLLFGENHNKMLGWPEELLEPSRDVIIDGETEDLFARFNEIRPLYTKKTANYIDALALKYLFALNDSLSRSGRAIIFISNSSAVAKVLEDTKRDNVTLDIGGTKYSCPIMFHPYAILLFLVHVGKDRIETLENLNKTKTSLVSISDEIAQYIDFFESDNQLLTAPKELNKKAEQQLTSAVEEFLSTWMDSRFTKLSLDNIDFLETATQRITGRLSGIRSKILSLTTMIRNHPDDVWETYERIINDNYRRVMSSAWDILSISYYSKVTHTHDSLISYHLFNLRNEDVLKLVEELYRHSYSVGNVLEKIEELKKNLIAEAFLLSAYIKNRIGDHFNLALKDIETGLSLIDTANQENLQTVLQFEYVRSMVLMNCGEIKKALSNSEFFALNHGDEYPILYVQLGFICWRAYVEAEGMIPGADKKAIEYTTKAANAAKHQVEAQKQHHRRRCLLL
ncbi:MAG TPA: hypothetical protein VF810_04740, partial [Patescibacteria group bacterium]